MSELIVNIPRSDFWEEMACIEMGTGVGTYQRTFIFNNLKGPHIQEAGYPNSTESFSNSDNPRYDLFPSTKNGKNFRYLLLAAALTIPKDMIP